MSLTGMYTYEEEWLLLSATLKVFIDAVNQIRTTVASPQLAVTEIRPHFAELLNDPDWLPEKYQNPAAQEGGMGPKTGMWLLYRSGDGGLAFLSWCCRQARKRPSITTWPGDWSVSTKDCSLKWYSVASMTGLRNPSQS